MSEHRLFPGAKRPIRIATVAAMRATNDERRIKLGLEIKLSGGSLVGMPGWCGDAYTAIAKDDSVMESCKVDVAYRGMNIDIHATPSSEKSLQLSGVMLSGFTLKKMGSKDEPDIVLVFGAIVPMSAPAWKWSGEMIGLSAYAAFKATQPAIFGGEEDEDSEEEDDDSQLELAGVPTKRSAKGPKRVQ